MTKRLLLLLPLAAAACVAKREVPSAPAPRPRTIPAPPSAPPPPAPAPAATGWTDLPLTPGTWTYAGAGASTSSATYGEAGAPVFRLYCEGPTRNLFLQRYGVVPGRATMTVRTSFGARSLSIDAGPQFATATLPARDAFADSMIFSRGRFSVEVAGSPMLVLPSWAEAARVVEDCRR